MKKTPMRVLLICLLALAMVLICACTPEPAPAEPSGTSDISETNNPVASIWKVTFCDGVRSNVLKEVEVEDGKTVSVPELTKDGYIIEG